MLLENFTGNGFIEGTELDGFLREFVSSANPTEVNSDVSTVYFINSVKYFFKIDSNDLY